MKLLDGSELAGYIKERQAHQVRGLRQASGIAPRLVIIQTSDNPVTMSYLRRKKAYGTDILIDVDIRNVDQAAAKAEIEACNADESVHGIIVQLPLPDPTRTDEILAAVLPEKDVDGLVAGSPFDPPTPLAIIWLLAGYNKDLVGKRLLVVGRGRLVGDPLARMWHNSGLDVSVVDKNTPRTEFESLARAADVIVSGTGVPGLITADMIKPDAVIVDAGVATDKNGLVGDVAPEVRELPDITITPLRGGVGPLTVCALFDNVIRATRLKADKQKS